MSATRKNSSNTGATAGMPSAAQISESLTSTLFSADSAAAQSVQALTLIQQARVTQLSRTAANLKAQFGANDAGVKAAEAAAGAAASTAARVAIVQQEINTASPQAPAKGFVLNGRVYDSNLQPLPGMTVFLVDGNNTYLRQFGFEYTDDTGYFQIVVSDAGNRPPMPNRFFWKSRTLNHDRCISVRRRFNRTPETRSTKRLLFQLVANQLAIHQRL